MLYTHSGLMWVKKNDAERHSDTMYLTADFERFLFRALVQLALKMKLGYFLESDKTFQLSVVPIGFLTTKITFYYIVRNIMDRYWETFKRYLMLW